METWGNLQGKTSQVHRGKMLYVLHKLLVHKTLKNYAIWQKEKSQKKIMVTYAKDK